LNVMLFFSLDGMENIWIVKWIRFLA